jgi:hypothetical protein
MLRLFYIELVIILTKSRHVFLFLPHLNFHIYFHCLPFALKLTHKPPEVAMYSIFLGHQFSLKFPHLFRFCLPVFKPCSSPAPEQEEGEMGRGENSHSS